MKSRTYETANGGTRGAMSRGMNKTTIETRVVALNAAHSRTLRACRVDSLTDLQHARRVVRLSHVGRALFRALTVRAK